jgi:hypothetical protein
MFLWNVDLYLQVYIASQHSRITASSSLPKEPQISENLGVYTPLASKLENRKMDLHIHEHGIRENLQSNYLPENISKKSLLSMVSTASAADDGFPWPAAPLPVLRSMYQSPDSEPRNLIPTESVFYYLLLQHQCITVGNSTQCWLCTQLQIQFHYVTIFM